MSKDMKLTVLGSGTCELRADRSSPAYLLEAADQKIMLDLGAGAWRRLTELGHRAADVTAVIISHHHLDHMADLLPLLFALNYDPGMAQAHVTLVAHTGLETVMAGLAHVFGHWVRPSSDRLALRWLEPGRGLELGGVRISCAPSQHIPTSLAFRLETDDASLAYLGDSEYREGLAGLARGAGLMIAHAAASDAQPKAGHLGPTQAGRLATLAGARSLLLSHLYAAIDPARSRSDAARAFSGPVWAAEDGMALAVGPAGAELHKP